MPLDTHWQEVSCEVYECQVQASGWQTFVDETTDLGQRQAHYIRRLSGRRFTETRDVRGTRFTFEPGSECFQTHRVRVDRPQIHIVQPGDWRKRVGERHVYDRSDQWQDDMATDLDNIRSR